MQLTSSDCVEMNVYCSDSLAHLFLPPDHDPTGTAIAFNSGGALYFNFRYFESLHFAQNNGDSRECYSYWFVVGCHELAHNLAKAHDRNHGFYTESYSIMYMPKLMDLLAHVQS